MKHRTQQNNNKNATKENKMVKLKPIPKQNNQCERDVSLIQDSRVFEMYRSGFIIVSGQKVTFVIKIIHSLGQQARKVRIFDYHKIN